VDATEDGGTEVETDGRKTLHGGDDRATPLKGM
jgi:hypothetical protein